MDERISIKIDTQEVSWVADHESEVRFAKFELSNQICWNKSPKIVRFESFFELLITNLSFVRGQGQLMYLMFVYISCLTSYLPAWGAHRFTVKSTLCLNRNNTLVYCCVGIQRVVINEGKLHCFTYFTNTEIILVIRLKNCDVTFLVSCSSTLEGEGRHPLFPYLLVTFFAIFSPRRYDISSRSYTYFFFIWKKKKETQKLV